MSQWVSIKNIFSTLNRCSRENQGLLMVMMCHLQSAQVRSFHQYTTYRGHAGAVVFSIFAQPNSLGLINEANETRSVQCRQPDKQNYWTQDCFKIQTMKKRQRKLKMKAKSLKALSLTLKNYQIKLKSESLRFNKRWMD